MVDWMEAWGSQGGRLLEDLVNVLDRLATNRALLLAQFGFAVFADAKMATGDADHLRRSLPATGTLVLRSIGGRRFRRQKRALDSDCSQHLLEGAFQFFSISHRLDVL